MRFVDFMADFKDVQFAIFCDLQPLRSVGRSNFDKGGHNLTTLIQKSTYINEKLLYCVTESIGQ